MRLWLVVAGMGLVTYGVRLSMLVFVRPGALPATARRALRYVTPAVLAAIIVPAVLYTGGSGAFDATPGNERFPAAVIAVVVAAMTRNAWLTIGVGMSALWVLQAL